MLSTEGGMIQPLHFPIHPFSSLHFLCPFPSLSLQLNTCKRLFSLFIYQTFLSISHHIPLFLRSVIDASISSFLHLIHSLIQPLPPLDISPPSSSLFSCTWLHSLNQRVPRPFTYKSSLLPFYPLSSLIYLPFIPSIHPSSPHRLSYRY